MSAERPIEVRITDERTGETRTWQETPERMRRISRALAHSNGVPKYLADRFLLSEREAE